MRSVICSVLRYGVGAATFLTLYFLPAVCDLLLRREG
jgi:hypothetical protein